MLIQSYHLIFILKYIIFVNCSIFVILLFGVVNNNKNTSKWRTIENSFYEKLIANDLEKQIRYLGDGGEPSFLEGYAKVIGDEQLKRIGVNEELSDHISYNRSLRDMRNPLCSEEVYDLGSMLKISLIIVFYNEPYSILLRTIHNALNTIPSQVLNELIIIDDASTDDVFENKFKYFIETRFPIDIVKLHRLKER